MNLTSWLIIAGAVVVFFALVILVLALRYRKVGPNEALIIAGGRKRTMTLADGTKRRRSDTATASAAASSSGPGWKRSTSCPWTSSPSRSARPRS